MNDVQFMCQHIVDNISAVFYELCDLECFQQQTVT